MSHDDYDLPDDYGLHRPPTFGRWHEVIAEIASTLEHGGGVIDAAIEFDLEAIAADAFDYDPQHGWTQDVDADRFWEIVEENAHGTYNVESNMSVFDAIWNSRNARDFIPDPDDVDYGPLEEVWNNNIAHIIAGALRAKFPQHTFVVGPSEYGDVPRDMLHAVTDELNTVDDDAWDEECDRLFAALREAAQQATED